MNESSTTPTRTIEALTERAREVVGANPKPAVRWLSRSRTPALRWRNGNETDWWISHAALTLQLSETEPLAINPDAVTLAAGFELVSARKWARAVFDAWLAWGAPVRDHAVLPLLVALGGDAFLNPLVSAITQWYREGRRALAEGATQLIAMVGTDTAITALDVISAEHPFDDLGALAWSALSVEANERGSTVEELVDSAVLSFGLDLDGTAELTDGRRRFRVTLVGLKPTLTDEVGRVLGAPPRASRPDVRREAVTETWRALSHDLGPVCERALRRAEDSLITQRTWAGEPWRTHLAGHPLLARIYRDLVWVTDTGETFVLSPSLTPHDALGNTVDVSSVGALRLAHPVVDAHNLVRWREVSLNTLLAQCDRSVVTHDKLDALFERKVLRAHDDRHGRGAQPWEREGWRVGAVEQQRFDALTWRVGRYGYEAVLSVDAMTRWAAEPRQCSVGPMVFRTTTGEPLGPAEVPKVFLSEACVSVLRMLETL